MAGGKVPKIVVVEDDAPIREMYVAKLEASGFEVFEAEDGQKGLDVIYQKRPDLILLDINLPNLSGKEMLVKLRKEDWGKATPVLVLTNLSQTEADMDPEMLSVERYVVKAYFTPKQIVDLVIETLQKYGKIEKPRT